ncbi:MAG: hypothetical protein Q7T54_04935 [Candidatus Levybacteria bacterium]|nr:hypothetical protein [Candidatus Levybacteria bacterium]
MPITPSEARKTLGNKAEKMSDKDIENLLIALRQLCSGIIDSVTEEKIT